MMWTHPRIKFYTKPYKLYQQNQRPNHTRETWLTLCYDCLNNANVSIYLLCGTCLGAIRENKLIDYDPDVDIGVPMQQFSAVFNALPDLLNAGFYIKYAKKWTLTLGVPASDFHIDIMVIKTLKNPVLYLLGYRYFFDQTLYKTYMQAPGTYQFLGRRFFIPEPIETYLSDLYGPRWFLPQKNTPSGVLPVISQVLYWPFVIFHLKPQHCGADWTLSWRPWVYALLNRYFPDHALTQKYRPRSDR